MKVFYRPDDGFVGDVVPFYWKGEYHAFYMKAPLVPKGPRRFDYNPYGHVVSRDLCTWNELPNAIELGEPGDPDSQTCSTGSVIERNAVFHLFYIGRTGVDLPELVCHATSRDLVKWEKDKRNPIMRADGKWYEEVDWRDPFVFWNEEAGEYWMILTARTRQGPVSRRGCLGLAVSPDLVNWEIRPPIWSPNLFHTPECPDLFRWDKKWVLVFSTFTDYVTHYRLAQTLDGPWTAPSNDLLDSRACYAQKTAGEGHSRYAFGWLPTREGGRDTGPWQWGGNLVVSRVGLSAEGNLHMTMPPSTALLFPRVVDPIPQPLLGRWETSSEVLRNSPLDGFSACLMGAMPERFRFELIMNPTSGTRYCGVLLRADKDLDRYYQLRWEPRRGRVTFDRWPRPRAEPFMLERQVDGNGSDKVKLNVIVEESAIVTYINDRVAFCNRGYDHKDGQVGVFVVEGEASFSNIKLWC
jgi:beta-fructofuranosidase